MICISTPKWNTCGDHFGVCIKIINTDVHAYMCCVYIHMICVVCIFIWYSAVHGGGGGVVDFILLHHLARTTTATWPDFTNRYTLQHLCQKFHAVWWHGRSLRVCIYMYVYKYLYIYVYIYVFVHKYSYVYIQLFVHIYVQVFVHMYIYVQIYKCICIIWCHVRKHTMYTYIYIYVYTSICTCIYMCTYKFVVYMICHGSMSYIHMCISTYVYINLHIYICAAKFCIYALQIFCVYALRHLCREFHVGLWNGESIRECKYMYLYMYMCLYIHMYLCIWCDVCKSSRRTCTHVCVRIHIFTCTWYTCIEILEVYGDSSSWHHKYMCIDKHIYMYNYIYACIRIYIFAGVFLTPDPTKQFL